jgi:hypothetical protein
MFKKPEQIKPLPSGMADAFSKTLERQGFKAPAPVQVQPTVVVAEQPQVVSEAAPAMNRIADKKEAPEKAKMVKMKDKVEAVESESCECGDDAEYDSKGMCESCGKPHAEGYSESFSPKEVKMAIGVASDKRYAGGNMSGASKAIDKIKKGLSSHPQVAAVLKRQNEELDTVNTKALKKDFSDRKDKDIDNDGDSDSSDEYLHKRRKAISKALASEAKMTPDQMKKALADDKAKAKPKGQVTLKKAPWDMKKEEVESVEEAVDKVAIQKQIDQTEKFMKSFSGNTSSVKMKKYALQTKLNKLKAQLAEEVELDEISTGKMAAYADKAVKSRNDAKAATHSADSNRRDKAQKTIVKRKAGADNYNKKMWGYSNVAPTKEHFEIIQDGGKVELIDIQEAPAYTLMHNTFSGAVQEAIAVAKKQGFEIDEDDWSNKVATGPKKPSKDKTNSYTIDLMKGGKPAKKKLHMQVYNMGPKYELNCYVQ